MNKMADKINGWMMVFRLILPIMVGFMIFQLGHIESEIRQLRNEYYHEIRTISERLARLETKLEGGSYAVHTVLG